MIASDEAILILDLQYHRINSHIFHYACKFGSVSISVEGFLFANLQSHFLGVMFEGKYETLKQQNHDEKCHFWREIASSPLLGEKIFLRVMH